MTSLGLLFNSVSSSYFLCRISLSFGGLLPFSSLPPSLLGISFKSQCLYATVFCTRYLDLFTNHISIYNTIMKIFFISSTLYIVYAMKTAFKATWDPKIDTMRVEFLVVPAAVLALIINERFRLLDVKYVLEEKEEKDDDLSWDEVYYIYLGFSNTTSHPTTNPEFTRIHSASIDLIIWFIYYYSPSPFLILTSIFLSLQKRFYGPFQFT